MTRRVCFVFVASQAAERRTRICLRATHGRSQLGATRSCRGRKEEQGLPGSLRDREKVGLKNRETEVLADDDVRVGSESSSRDGVGELNQNKRPDLGIRKSVDEVIFLPLLVLDSAAGSITGGNQPQPTQDAPHR